MTKKNDSDLQHETSYREYWLALFAFLVSAAASVGVQKLSAQATPFNLSEAYLNTLLGFATFELLRLLLRFMTVEAKLKRQEQNLQAVIGSNAIRTKISLAIYKAFFEDKVAHGAAARSISNLFHTIDIGDDKLVFKTDFLALQFYQEFWEVILDAQKRLNRMGRPPLKVFATHSASIRVWERQEFVRSRQQQEQFCSEGGEIYRVLIRPTTSHEKLEDYEQIMTSMREHGVLAYFLDQKQTSLSNVHEYMLVSLDGEFHAIAWNPTWPPTERGTLSAIEVQTGAEALRQEFWVRWRAVLGELEKPPQTNLSALLAQRPTAEVLEDMRELS